MKPEYEFEIRREGLIGQGQAHKTDNVNRAQEIAKHFIDIGGDGDTITIRKILKEESGKE